MITHIGTVAVYVSDPDDALGFWTEQVGFELKSERPMTGSTRWLDRWVRRPRTTRRASRVRTTDAELRYRKWKPVAAPDADGSPSCTE